MAQASNDSSSDAPVAATAPLDRAAGDRPPLPISSADGRGAPAAAAPLSARAAAAMLALVPLSLLGVAGGLDPDPGGLGTHQQLGLPPCSMRLVLGVRCPSCGMTTSWSHFMRGQWPESWAANPGGFLLALYSVAFGSLSAMVAWRGRLPSFSLQRGFALALVAIAAVALTQWLWRMA